MNEEIETSLETAEPSVGQVDLLSTILFHVDGSRATAPTLSK
jgi:hypothetical protein